jgi:hypothetical protein
VKQQGGSVLKRLLTRPTQVPFDDTFNPSPQEQYHVESGNFLK